MLYPIIPPTFPAGDLAYSLSPAELAAELFTRGGGMSPRDRFARLLADAGDPDDFAADGFGYGAMVVPLLPRDRVLLAWVHAFHYSDGSRRARVSLPISAGHVAFIRWDDAGFHDLETMAADDAADLFARWTRANVPTYCDWCGAMLDREVTVGPDGYCEEYPAEGLCGDCEEATYREAETMVGH